MADFDIQKAKARLAASREVNIDKLAQADIELFFNFMKYVTDNLGIEKSVDYLKSKGYFQIMFSVEVYRALQEMVIENAAAGKSLTPQDKNYLMCGKGNAVC